MGICSWDVCGGAEQEKMNGRYNVVAGKEREC